MRRFRLGFWLAIAASLVGCSQPKPSPIVGTWLDPEIRAHATYRADGTYAAFTLNADGSQYSSEHGTYTYEDHQLDETEASDKGNQWDNSGTKHRYRVEWLDDDTFGFRDEDALYLKYKRR